MIIKSIDLSGYLEPVASPNRATGESLLQGLENIVYFKLKTILQIIFMF